MSDERIPSLSNLGDLLTPACHGLDPNRFERNAMQKGHVAENAAWHCIMCVAWVRVAALTAFIGKHTSVLFVCTSVGLVAALVLTRQHIQSAYSAGKRPVGAVVGFSRRVHLSGVVRQFGRAMLKEAAEASGHAARAWVPFVVHIFPPLMM